MKKNTIKFTFLLQIIIASIAISNAQPSQIGCVFHDTAPQDVIEKMQKNASAVFTEINKAAIENRDLKLSSANATEEAIENIHAIWATSHFHCIRPTYYQHINKISQGYSVRNIPVYFRADNTLDNKNQDLVINFDLNGKISNIFIAIEKTQYEKIKESGITITEIRHRTLALDFLEQFGTAYCRKDLPFIEQVFSDNALIITGNKLIVTDKDAGPKTVVKYKEMNKEQYISNLKSVFANNKSLDIKFAEDKIKIFQHPNNSNIYAIRCWQDWNSIKLDGNKGYSDSGWLTLIIDFTNEDAPAIWVRAWQDPGFTEKELIKVGDFNF